MNVWKIHCRDCTVENPCPPCAEQIAAENEHFNQHVENCTLPLPLCPPCAEAFGLKS